MKRHPVGVCVVLAVLLAASGCIRQRVAVNSEPQGAKVYFDGYYKGETPVEFDFKWHGKHVLRVEKDGYAPLRETVDLKAPAHMTVPLDFFMELAPFEVRDRKEFAFELESQG